MADGQLQTNSIAPITTNGNLTLAGNGTGKILISSDVKLDSIEGLSGARFDLVSPTVVNAMLFPTSGGVPSGLDYYEEYTFSTNLSCTCWVTSPVAVSIKVTRIGRIVLVKIPAQVGTNDAGGSSGTIFSTTGIPTRFRPSEDTYDVVRVTDMTVIVGGCMKLESSTGVLFWGVGYDFGNFDNSSGVSGIYASSISWSV
jgi:hypothetical protein